MSFLSSLKKLFGQKKSEVAEIPRQARPEVDEIPGQAHPLRDAICASLSSEKDSVEDIVHRIEAGLRQASLNQSLRQRLAFIARLIVFITATDAKACEAAAKAISEALADATETKPVGRASYVLTGAAREALYSRRDVTIPREKNWAELVRLINRLEPLAKEDGELRSDLYFTCECLESIAFRLLDNAMNRSGAALNQLKLDLRLAQSLNYWEALKNPEYANRLRRDPRIAESKELIETAQSYLHKSLETRNTRTLSGGRGLESYSECINFLRSL